MCVHVYVRVCLCVSRNKRKTGSELSYMLHVAAYQQAWAAYYQQLYAQQGQQQGGGLVHSIITMC